MCIRIALFCFEEAQIDASRCVAQTPGCVLSKKGSYHAAVSVSKHISNCVHYGWPDVSLFIPPGSHTLKPDSCKKWPELKKWSQHATNASIFVNWYRVFSHQKASVISKDGCVPLAIADSRDLWNGKAHPHCGFDIKEKTERALTLVGGVSHVLTPGEVHVEDLVVDVLGAGFLTRDDVRVRVVANTAASVVDLVRKPVHALEGRATVHNVRLLSCNGTTAKRWSPTYTRYFFAPFPSLFFVFFSFVQMKQRI